MAGTLNFPAEGVRRVADAAAAKGEGALLVKDQGVYLMAGGTGGPDVVLVYADGMDPKVDDFDDWWHTAARICGGDDFGEIVDAAFLAAVAAKGKGLRVRVSETHLSMEEC